jgi:methionyl-tRNA formyltransferase
MRVVFLGRRPHGSEALCWLVDQGHEVVTVVAPTGVSAEVPYSRPTVAETALRLGLPVCDSHSFKEQLAASEEAFGEVDLVISFLFWERITKPVRELAKFGCINFHPAPLPNYKGLGGYNFAILDKLEEWGASAHYVDKSFDTGPIIQVSRFPFDWRTATALSLEHQTRAALLDLFYHVVSRVAECGWLETEGNVGGRYYTREDMESGKKIDLDQMDEEEVALRVRAFWYPPFDGAYVEIGGARFTLVSSDILAELSPFLREQL